MANEIVWSGEVSGRRLRVIRTTDPEGRPDFFTEAREYDSQGAEAWTKTDDPQDMNASMCETLAALHDERAKPETYGDRALARAEAFANGDDRARMYLAEALAVAVGPWEDLLGRVRELIARNVEHDAEEQNAFAIREQNRLDHALDRIAKLEEERQKLALGLLNATEKLDALHDHSHENARRLDRHAAELEAQRTRGNDLAFGQAHEERRLDILVGQVRAHRGMPARTAHNAKKPAPTKRAKTKKP